MKPKQNKVGDKNKSSPYDRCQTPFYAVDPLIKHIPKDLIVWEPAAGDGQIVRKLKSEGYKNVWPSDILDGKNFFDYSPPLWQCIITNPPYSIKYDWLKRCYELGKPFALLLPLETLGAAKGQKLFKKYGMELIILSRRVNFKMPNIGYGGGGTQFPTAWFTNGFNIGGDITYEDVVYYDDEQIKLF